MLFFIPSLKEMRLPMTPVTKTKMNDLIDQLNEAKKRETPLSVFELHRFKTEAEKLKNADLAEAFTVLGIIASIEGDISEMHRLHQLAITYSSRDPGHLYNYAVSLGWKGLLTEAIEYAKEAYRRSLDRVVKIDALGMIIEAYHLLRMEEDFIDYAYEWEALTGEPHKLVSEECIADEEELDDRLAAHETDVQENRNSFVRFNLNELDEVDRLLNNAKE